MEKDTKLFHREKHRKRVEGWRKKKPNCICLNCKKGFFRQLSQGYTGKYCSHKCYVEHKIGKPYEWAKKRKGYLSDGKYKLIRIYEEMPGGYTKGLKAGKYIREHIYLVQKDLGRKLKSNEVVHHINFDSFDNRLENLLVLTRAQHNRLHFLLAKLAMEKLKLTKEDLLKMLK